MKKSTAILTAAAISALLANTALASEKVPVRKVFEDNGGTVTYNSTNNTVDIDYLDSKINIVIGGDTVNFNGGDIKADTELINGRTVIDSESLEKIMKSAEALDSVEEIKLNLGKVLVYDFGSMKLHSYISNDALYDVSYLVEKGDNLVIVESSAFKANIEEWNEYIKSLKKNVAGQLMAYHPNGADFYGDYDIYATGNAVDSWGENGSIKVLTDGFVTSFGDAVEEKMPQNIKLIETGDKINIGGIDFNIIEAGDDAYSIEIPEINCVYRHMMGSKCHNIIPSLEYIDAEIETLESYEGKGYTLILTSHYDPEGQGAIAEKIDYMTKTKQIAEKCSNADEFIDEMKKTFSGYTGDNYLEMTAQMLY